MKSIAGPSTTYTTPRQALSWIARHFPTPVFYTKLLRAVFHASHLAQNNRYDAAAWHSSSLAVLRSLESVGVQIDITGLSSLHEIDGPCVLVANHMSTLETIVLPGIVQPYKDVTFIVKRGIVEYPVFKHIMLARDPIVVDRESARADLERVLDQGPRLLQSGRSIVVFPQTTRTLTFDPAHFNTIGVKLARQAGVPIVPIAVRSDAWSIGRFVKEFGRINPALPVHFAFGEAIPVSGRGTDAHHAATDFIRARLDAWGCAVL